uniref:DNA mismatch repair protein mutS putative n=1 Tax=Albugo laibachii Nc14 TaxID=890382 RepID=F0WEY8_9STRA|nr:DNA mismatch repair protein mutS putative [Albugo laibachii Nc14]|eukprot:CCA19770.1 DNA mismatch repair protein mutS putative [Albugo laibachii Nc14]
MCGFPINSLDSYLEKLVMHHGLKVAICNQIKPKNAIYHNGNHRRGKKASAKLEPSIMDRRIVRVVTPGSLVEESMLKPEENNYLAALYTPLQGDENRKYGFAWADLSTGEFRSTSTTIDQVANLLIRCSPREILIPTLDDTPDSSLEAILHEALPPSCMKTYRRISSFHSVETEDRQLLTSIAAQDEVEAFSANAIVDYIQFAYTQNSGISAGLKQLRHVDNMDHMVIDHSAWKSLELSTSLSGDKSSSLFYTINKTVTAAGSRLLASHLASPLLDIETIRDRQDTVQYFSSQELLILKPLRKQLANMCDLERSLQRITVYMGTPRDLRNIASSVEKAVKIAGLMMSSRPPNANYPRLLTHHCNGKREHTGLLGLVEKIQAAIYDDSSESMGRSYLNAKHNFVRSGYSKELDEWRAIAMISTQTQGVSPEYSKSIDTTKQTLQQKYRSLLRSTRARVLYQTGRGFFIELSVDEYKRLVRERQEKAHESVEPLDQLILLQSLKTTMRFRTEELSQLNDAIIEAEERVHELESQIFDDLVDFVLDQSDSIRSIAETMAILDVLSSHAQVALDCHYTRPLIDTSREIHIEDGRHCVVEAAHWRGRNNSLSRSVSSSLPRAFVPNSLHLQSCTEPQGNAIGSCCFLTGPNMGGKSTFLRQNAQIVILAQMGCFVPARYARIGLVDQLFCRVGSADDLASDKSTFMIEMEETASILGHATARSLVIMDEVGRGTSVEDGIAIAGAVLETLCLQRIRTLFATHYTILPQLLSHANANVSKMLQLFRMEAVEMDSTRKDLGTSHHPLAFTHRVVPGLASRSYGLNTATLAGCPSRVVMRANQLLQLYRQQYKQDSHRCDLGTLEQLDAIKSMLGIPFKTSDEDQEALLSQVAALLSR